MSNKAQHTSPLPPRLERLPTVKIRTGQSRATIYRGIAAGTFPKPVKIGARSIAFIAAEVDSWIAARAAERDGAARA
jgi:prophage regulatory protein